MYYVLLSGGQDSVTTLAYAIHTHGASNIKAISLNYDQRHSGELTYAMEAADYFNVEHKVINVGNIFPATAMNSRIKDIKADGGLDNLPTTFVPGRNALFLTLAASHLAMEDSPNGLYIGVSQADYSGYPDCREDFIHKMQAALASALPFNLTIFTPLLYRTKAQTFDLADKMGCLDFVITNTLTCYHGIEAQNEFGRGCGECPACELRKKGYEEFRSNHHA